jgi:hypothetical protein
VKTGGTEIGFHKFIAQKEMLQKAGPVLFIAGISLSVLFTFAIDIALLISFLFRPPIAHTGPATVGSLFK